MNATIRNILVGTLMAAALPVFAQTTGTANTATPAPKFDVVCMQNAIDKRDTAIISAVDTSATAIKNALGTRRDALKAAWGLTDRKARRDGIRVAWKAWFEASRSARKDLQSARTAAWNTFYTDRKACGKGVATEDTTTHAVDASI